MLAAVAAAPPVARCNELWCKNARKKNDLGLGGILIVPDLYPHPLPLLFLRLFSRMSANSRKPCCPITTTRMNPTFTAVLT